MEGGIEKLARRSGVAILDRIRLGDGEGTGGSDG